MKAFGYEEPDHRLRELAYRQRPLAERWAATVGGHAFDRAGTHFDFRRDTRTTTGAYSWLVRIDRRLVLEVPDIQTHAALEEWARLFLADRERITAVDAAPVLPEPSLL